MNASVAEAGTVQTTGAASISRQFRDPSGSCAVFKCILYYLQSNLLFLTTAGTIVIFFFHALSKISQPDITEVVDGCR